MTTTITAEVVITARTMTRGTTIPLRRRQHTGTIDIAAETTTIAAAVVVAASTGGSELRQLLHLIRQRINY